MHSAALILPGLRSLRQFYLSRQAERDFENKERYIIHTPIKMILKCLTDVTFVEGFVSVSFSKENNMKGAVSPNHMKDTVNNMTVILC